MKKKYLIAFILPVLTTYSMAQTTLFRYVDSKGRTIYTDSVPASEKGKIDTLSAKTMALKSINEKELSPEEVETKKAVLEEQKNTQLESDLVKQKNQALLTTYSSVNDIDKMKEYEVQQINRAISSDNEAINSLTDRRLQLEEERRNANGKLTTKADTEYKAVEQNIKSAQDNLQKNQTLLESREKKYNDDKTQYLSVLEKMGQAKK